MKARKNAEQIVFENIKKNQGLCHVGTIAQDTNYCFATVKRVLKKLIYENKICNEPRDGKNAYYLIR